MNPLKFVVTGPESSGKTTLSQFLGRSLGWEVLPEYARAYLTNLGRPYNEEDFENIVKGQFVAEQEKIKKVAGPLILDTSLVVLHIWYQEKWGKIHPFIEDQLKTLQHTYFILCKPDLPWEFDPLREHPEERLYLFERYLTFFRNRDFPFAIIEGEGRARREVALNQLKKWHLEVDF